MSGVERTLWAQVSGAEAVNGVPSRPWRFEGSSYYQDVTEEYVPAEALVGAVDRLRAVTEALDDAIAHNVNATEHDPAGWTQEDYDAWEKARADAENYLAGR